MSDYIIGLAKADQIAVKVLSKYDISISIGTIDEGVIFTLDWMNYQQVITDSDSWKNHGVAAFLMFSSYFVYS